MTNQEAIEQLKRHQESKLTERTREALDMAIEALEKQPIAFDVEKVVEQLEQYRDKYGEKWVNSLIVLSDAIEIVRCGGVNGCERW